jgi:hypothetical protein
VSSYYLRRERVVLDPLLPPDGLEHFERVGAPEHVLLSNRHHDRDAWRLQDAFGCQVHCVRAGLHELSGRGRVLPFDFGDELPGGVIAHEIGAICPDETAFQLSAYDALACADGIVRMGTGADLGFVPDSLMDEPAQTKRRLGEAYRRLLDAGVEFELLLLAHGEPLTHQGAAALRAFLDSVR